MPFVLLALAIALALVALVPLSLLLRYRAGTARRRARAWLAAVNAAALCCSTALFLAAAAVTSLWVSRAFAYALLGLAGGCLLGLLGIWLSRWEATPAALHYTPNRWLVLALMLVVLSRLAYGIWRGWHAWRSALGDGSALAAFGVASSLAAGALVLGYYLAYWTGIWHRARRHRLYHGAMRTTHLAGGVLAAAVLGLSCGGADRPTPAAPTPTPAPASSGPATFTLFWSDEFNAPAGTPIDPLKWKHDVGGGGWGNNQLEYDTESVSNASHDGDGHLVITARRERFTGRDGVTREYTSARINTAGRFEHAYGRFEARIQIPVGKGVWPAFWMLGADIGPAGWPACGEIDIMENVGHEPSTNHGSLHGPGYSGATPMTGLFSLPGGQRFTDGFHVFAIEWEPAAVRWYVDGALYQTRTPSSLPAGTRWVFDHPFFIILNVAVGGNWPGSPDATTVFPQEMRVDWVRVHRLN